MCLDKKSTFKNLSLFLFSLYTNISRSLTYMHSALIKQPKSILIKINICIDRNVNERSINCICLLALNQPPSHIIITSVMETELMESNHKPNKCKFKINFFLSALSYCIMFTKTLHFVVYYRMSC